MDIVTILSVLKELGILNLLVVVLMLNLPSVLIVVFSHFTIKTHIRDEYLTKESYRKGVENFYNDVFKPLKDEFKELTNSMEKLSNALNRQNETMARYDERFRLMGSNNGQGAN